MKESTPETWRWKDLGERWAKAAKALGDGFVLAREARTKAKDSWDKDRDSADKREALAQASLAELAAAKALNDFLDTDRRGLKRVTVIENQLRNNDSLSLLDRHALQVEKRNLIRTVSEFLDFKESEDLSPVYPPPARVEGKIHYSDGSVQWDPATKQGRAGMARDAFTASASEWAKIAPLSKADQYIACVGALDALTGRLTSRMLPAPIRPGRNDPWGDHVWGGLAEKAFSPAQETCRRLYPAAGLPEGFDRHGALDAGSHPELALAPVPTFEHLNDFRHPDHPLHASYQRFMRGMQKADEGFLQGSVFERHTPAQHERIAAALAVAQGMAPSFKEVGRIHQDQDALWAIELPVHMDLKPRWLKIDLAQALAQPPEAHAAHWRAQHVPPPPVEIRQAPAVDPNSLPPTDLRHPQHPRHAMFAQVREALGGEYHRWGLVREPAQLDRESALLVQQARGQRIGAVGRIQRGAVSGPHEPPGMTLYEKAPHAFPMSVSVSGAQLAQAPEIEQTSTQLQGVEQQVALLQQQQREHHRGRDLTQGHERGLTI